MIKIFLNNKYSTSFLHFIQVYKNYIPYYKFCIYSFIKYLVYISSVAQKQNFVPFTLKLNINTNVFKISKRPP